MILFWKGPALLIIILSVIAGVLLALGIQAIFDFSDDTMGALLIILSSIGILGGDIYYRKNNRMSMFSLKASTVFFVIPTWIIGATLLLIVFVAIIVPGAESTQ